MNLLVGVVANQIRDLLAEKGVRARIIHGLAHPGNVGHGEEVLTIILEEKQPDFGKPTSRG